MKYIVVYLMGAESVLYDSHEYHLIAKDGEKYTFAVLE